MGAYKRKLKKGVRWFYSGQFYGHKYHSKAEFKTKTACLQAERERLIKIEKEMRRPSPHYTLHELCTARLDYLETKNRTYYKDNKRMFKKLIIEWGKNKDVKKITRPMIQKYLLGQAKRLKAEGYDNYSVNAEIRHLKALFNYAKDELECIDEVPTSKMKFFAIDKKLKYIPPDDHINMVCEYVHPYQRDLLWFCIETGCRISEALRATGDDIDLEKNLLTLWTRKKRYGDLTPRRIKLPEVVREMKRDGLLFPQWSQYPRFLEKACKFLGIKLFGFHAMRHRRASIMAEKGVQINQIQYFLGHESIVITQEYLQFLGFQY